jgi:hypothetical protein
LLTPAACQAAGITPVLITGDHPATARAIATDLGIIGPGEPVIDCRAASGAETGGTARVFARATPEQKPSIIAGRHIFADVVGRTIEQVADPVNAGARGVGLLAASRSASSPSTRYQRTLRQPLRRIHRALPAQPQGLRPPQPRTYQHAGNIRQKGPASGRDRIDPRVRPGHRVETAGFRRSPRW